jgi:hypothetical protein
MSMVQVHRSPRLPSFLIIHRRAMIWRSMTSIVAVLLFSPVFSHAQGSASSVPPPVGVVSGVLLTYEQKLASGYIVDIVGTSRSSTGRARVQTDDEGKFRFEHLGLGTYALAPYLESDNSRYPGGLLRSTIPLQCAFNSLNPSLVGMLLFVLVRQI